MTAKKVPHYIEVLAGVRYWDDATVNGIEDSNGSRIPFRKGELWCPVIRLQDGLVSDWPLGCTASIHYKVCDAGMYYLQDSAGKPIAKWAGDYVPDSFLCHGSNGYGDYIILDIDAEGFVHGWEQPSIEWVCDCDTDAQTGWRALV